MATEADLDEEMSAYKETLKHEAMPSKDKLLETIMEYACAQQYAFRKGLMTKEDEQEFIDDPKVGFIRAQRKSDSAWVTLLAMEIPGKDNPESDSRVHGIVPLAEILSPAAALDYHAPKEGGEGLFGKKNTTDGEVKSGIEFLREEEIIKTH